MTGALNLRRLRVQTNLHFGGDEEAGDADELQRGLQHVPLRGHEAVEVILSEVIRLSVQLVDLAYLQTENSEFRTVRWTVNAPQPEGRHQTGLNGNALR